MWRRFKRFLRRKLPSKCFNVLWTLREWRDPLACFAFLWNSEIPISLRERWSLVKQLYLISFNVESPHTQKEVLQFLETILSLSDDTPGVVVEAGCFKGGSTAKVSLAADLAGRELVVFDSFQGIPKNAEPHRNNIFGGDAVFSEGDYAGSLEEVRANVRRYGKIECCRFIQGWFDDTMPEFHEKVATAYLDVDLVSSARTCLRYLYPLLAPEGLLFSQDGHLPLVIGLLDDPSFWADEVGFTKPTMEGLGCSKLVRIKKPLAGKNSGSLIAAS